MTRPEKMKPVARPPSMLACALIATLLLAPLGVAAQQPTGEHQDAVLAYAQCMRENGFAEFPDPSPDGRLQMRVNPQSAPRYRAAQQACRDLAPPGLAADGLSAEQMDALLALSSCMRENGIAEYPDPNSSGQLNLSGTSIDPQSPTFEAAMAACRDEAGGLGGVPINIVR